MDSVLTKNQKRSYRKDFKEHGEPYLIEAVTRYDDSCGNGKNSFSLTGTIWKTGSPSRHECGGCIHEQIAAHFPDLASLVKWHLCSSDGPMYYLENTLYLAGDRDCHGLLKDEFRPHTSRGQQNQGVAGIPNWVLEIPKGQARDVYAVEKPWPVTLEWTAYGRTGEGKARELDAARRCAVWPDATDADLTAPGLKERLEARLPALLVEFRQAIEALGFAW